MIIHVLLKPLLFRGQQRFFGSGLSWTKFWMLCLPNPIADILIAVLCFIVDSMIIAVFHEHLFIEIFFDVRIL